MRTFVAVTLPIEIKEALRKTSGELKRLDLHGRCSRVESIHVTLKFLGEISGDQVEEIGEAMRSTSRDVPPFRLVVERMGVFPHLQRPRVVWVGVRQARSLVLLHERLEQSLAVLGFSPEDRPFRPHLTLMRLKSQRNLPRLVKYLSRQGANLSIGDFEVTSIDLFQSLLKPEGAEYRKLLSVPLVV